jgi:hypothetical protein
MSFAYLDPDMHHYAMASSEVIVQIHGIAPMQFEHIHSEDDPARSRFSALQINLGERMTVDTEKLEHTDAIQSRL